MWRSRKPASRGANKDQVSRRPKPRKRNHYRSASFMDKKQQQQRNSSTTSSGEVVVVVVVVTVLSCARWWYEHYWYTNAKHRSYPLQAITSSNTAQRVEYRQVCRRLKTPFVVLRAVFPCSLRSGTRLWRMPLDARLSRFHMVVAVVVSRVPR